MTPPNPSDDFSTEISAPIIPKPHFFLGVPVHSLTMEQSVVAISGAIKSRRKVRQVSLNVAKFVTLNRNRELAADVSGADLISADGMGIVLGARLFGIPIPERVAGVDLMQRLLELCAHEGLRPYLLGARQDVLERALAELKNQYPALKIAGFHHGYFTPSDEADVVASIREASPDCLFVGLPSPRKERFMAKHCDAMGVPYVMGVGGSIDVLAKEVHRAPLHWQNLGMEWLFRTIQEPRRMWRRYLTTNFLYGCIILTALCRRVLGVQASRPLPLVDLQDAH